MAATVDSAVAGEFTTVDSNYLQFLHRESILKIDTEAPLPASVVNFGPIKLVPVEHVDSLLADYDSMIYKETSNKKDLRKREMHLTWNATAICTVLKEIQEKHEDYWHLLSMHTRVIVLDCLEPFGSASASDAWGVMSLNCKNHYSKEDVLEMIVHELVHNLVFIDDVNNPYFHKQFDNIPLQIHSPIRNERRAIHLTVHALLVALEILRVRHLRKTFNDPSNAHPNSDVLVKNLYRTLAEIANHTNVLTPHSRDLLQKSASFLTGLVHS